MVKFVSKMEKIRLEPMESVDSQDSRIEIGRHGRRAAMHVGS